MEVSQVAQMPAGSGEPLRSDAVSPEGGEAAGAQDLFAMLVAHVLQMAEASTAATSTAEGVQPVDADSSADSLVSGQATGDASVQADAAPEIALGTLVAQLSVASTRSTATYRVLPEPTEVSPNLGEAQPAPNEAVSASSQTTPQGKIPVMGSILDLDPDLVVAEGLESLVDTTAPEPPSLSKSMKLFEAMMRAAASRVAMSPKVEGRVAEVIPTATGPPSGQVETAALESVVSIPTASSGVSEKGVEVLQSVPEPVMPEPATSTLDNLGRATLKSVRYLVSRGEATIKIRLEPPSLGDVRFDVTSVDRVLSIRLASANPVVREILEGHLAGLRESLVRDGHQVTEVSVTADAASGHSSAHEHRRPAPFETSPHGSPSGPQEHGLHAGRNDEGEKRTPTHVGTLNLFI